MGLMSQVSTVAFLVENQPGVLFNVSNLFRRRGFNIESITVGPLLDKNIARMTISVKADSKVLNMIVDQLDKMVDVIKVKRLDPMRTVFREMALFKVDTSDPMAREEFLRHVNSFHGLILNIEPECIIAEITGEPGKIDEFIELTRVIGIEEISRTGMTALEKGQIRL